DASHGSSSRRRRTWPLRKSTMSPWRIVTPCAFSAAASSSGSTASPGSIQVTPRSRGTSISTPRPTTPSLVTPNPKRLPPPAVAAQRRRRGAHLLRRVAVQRPALVVRAPATPVLHRLEQPVDLRGRHPRTVVNPGGHRRALLVGRSGLSAARSLRPSRTPV